MVWRRVWAWFLGFAGVAGLSGCFSSVRRVQKVDLQAPGTYKTATVEELEKTIAERDAAIRTLQASVMVTATTGGERTGKEKTYTSFRGYVFLQKPSDLRVILQLPFVGSTAMDMVSDGEKFTLDIPPRHTAYVGTNTVSKPSANGLENLRPSVFTDSLLIPGISPDEYVTRTESTRIVTPARGRRDAVEEPDYDLQVQRVKEGHDLKLERVVHFSRVTLLPFQQDVYDEHGQVVTQALYENYQADAGGALQPRSITISRPLDQYTLRLDVTKLTLNPQFDADQFVPPRIPATYKVVRMQ
jgi:outer membrane lipoprotein-sorting protein